MAHTLSDLNAKTRNASVTDLPLTAWVQPGLTGLLRLYALIQLIKSFVLARIAVVANDGITWAAMLPVMTSIAFLVLVVSGALKARLGRGYIAAIVAIGAIDALLFKHDYWFWFATRGAFSLSSQVSAVLTSLTPELVPGVSLGLLIQTPLSQMSMLVGLFLLLIVISWQYDIRYAIGFTILTTLVDVSQNVSMQFMGAPYVASSNVIIAGRTLIFLIVGNVIAHLASLQRRQQQSLIEANDKLIRYAATVEELTISRERNRMARELHDTLAHTLSAATVQLEATHALWSGDTVKAHASLERAIGAIRNGLNETRRAVKALRAAPLEDLGFVLALKELGNITQERCGARVQVSAPISFEPIPANIEHALYRAAQEALENIVRHAQARDVQLTITQDVRMLRMTIADDGTGFAVAQSIGDMQHFGLRGITERIEAVGGRVLIESTADSGSCIVVEVARA